MTLSQKSHWFLTLLWLQQSHIRALSVLQLPSIWLCQSGTCWWYSQKKFLWIIQQNHRLHPLVKPCASSRYAAQTFDSVICVVTLFTFKVWITPCFTIFLRSGCSCCWDSAESLTVTEAVFEDIMGTLEQLSWPELPGGRQRGSGFFPSQPVHGGGVGEEQEGEGRREQREQEYVGHLAYQGCTCTLYVQCCSWWLGSGLYCHLVPRLR